MFKVVEMDAGKEMGDVKYEEKFVLNSRGSNLVTCRWLPANAEPKALIFLNHGYGMDCSIFMQETGERFAKAGYAVFGIDYEGHGKSSGLRVYVPSFDQLVQDCATFFKSIAEREKYKDKSRFLYGESMGGAVALLIHRKQPGFWSGAVLVAPMCKIADSMKPHPLITSLLKMVTVIIHISHTWRIVPYPDIIDKAFKDPEKRRQIRSNSNVQGSLRLKTAYELLMTSDDLEKRLDKVTLPFLVLHGEDDKVTDPSVSEMLNSKAKSCDKTLKLYPGMWHCLTFGGLPDDIERVFENIMSWLDERSNAGWPPNTSAT